MDANKIVPEDFIVVLQQAAPSLIVYQTCISVEFVYGLVQPPSRYAKYLGKAVITYNFRLVAGEGTGTQAEQLHFWACQCVVSSYKSEVTSKN